MQIKPNKSYPISYEKLAFNNFRVYFEAHHFQSLYDLIKCLFILEQENVKYLRVVRLTVMQNIKM